jgi:hypothetical protein
MTLPVTNCIFCGATNLTFEHMFPQWCHRFMLPRPPGRISMYRGIEYADRTVSTPRTTARHIRDWQIKCVCGGSHLTCNNGWMRDLENAVRPIMIPLIRGEEVRINSHHQGILATWAAMKMMISEYDQNARITVHHMQRKYMFRHHIPPRNGWGVWVGNYLRLKFKPEWISQPLLVLSKR